MTILWDEAIGPYVAIYGEWGLWGILLLAIFMVACMVLDIWVFNRAGSAYPSRDRAPQRPTSPPHGGCSE